MFLCIHARPKSIVLIERKLVGKNKAGVRVLGDGKLERALTVKAHHFSKSAAEKIRQAGGSVEVIAL